MSDFYCEECDEFHDTDFPMETDTMDKSLNYIERRIYTMYYNKQDHAHEIYLKRTFPKDMAQLKTWLKTGNYIFDPEMKDDDKIYREHDAIYWDKRVPDGEGYRAAMSKLQAAKQKALDTVNIATDEKIRLDALREFEAYTVN